MTCNDIRSLFPEALYRELDDRRMAEFNAHLVTCGGCAGEFEGLKRTMAVLDRRQRIEPTESEWADFSSLLDSRLDAGEPGEHPQGARAVLTIPSPRKSRARILSWPGWLSPSWGYGLAAVLLVAFGVYLGRTFLWAPPDAAGGGGSPSIAEGAHRRSSADDSTGRHALAYLERSRNLLIGLTNLDEDQSESFDLSRHQRISHELYQQGNTLAVALNQPSQQQLRQLVQNLQIILLQLSNTGVGDGGPAIELVRQGVDAKSILLKINLEAIRASLGEAQVSGPDVKHRNQL